MAATGEGEGEPVELETSLFVLSPNGKIGRVPPRSTGKKFSANRLSVKQGGHRKRARLCASKNLKGVFNARLSDVVARDTSIRDCTAAELEASIKTPLPLPAASITPLMLPSQPVSTPATTGTSSVPGSQSILGAALAEAGKFETTSSATATPAPSSQGGPKDANPVASPAPFSFGAPAPLSIGGNPIFTAGGGGSSTKIPSQRRKGRRKA